MPTYTMVDGVSRELTSWPVMADGVQRELNNMVATVGGVQREIFSGIRYKWEQYLMREHLVASTETVTLRLTSSESITKYASAYLDSGSTETTAGTIVTGDYFLYKSTYYCAASDYSSKSTKAYTCSVSTEKKLIGTVQSKDLSDYPANGLHTDGYWYRIVIDGLLENFSENEWSTIIKACQYGYVPDTWAVGDQKSMTIGGANYLIDIIGKDHDSYADGSGTAPLTLQMHELFKTAYQMNSSQTNVGGWKESAMRNTHLPAMLAQMPTEVQTAIREVGKTSSAGNQSSTIDTTADKLFLLSHIEIAGTTIGNYYSQISATGEGSQYAYYASGGSKIKNSPGSSASMWSTRSAYLPSSETFICYNSSGNIVQSASYCYAAPAFCF